MRSFPLCLARFFLTLACATLAASQGFCEGALVFFEQHDASGDVQLRAQRLSAAGKLVWLDGKGSVAVAQQPGYIFRSAVAVRDGAGGAIVVFEGEARSGSAAADTDLWAQRVDGNGKLLWNAGAPLAVAASSRPETDPVVVSDGAGGAIIGYAWRDLSGRVDLEAQRISAAGKLLWGDPANARPVDVVESTEVISLAPRMAMAPDGVGGAIAAYQISYLSGEYEGDSDTAAQRVSAGGERLWPTDEGGVTVSSSKHTERNPTLISDGQGGVIAVFEHEYRSGDYAGDCDILAQRLSRDGKMLWNDGEKSVVVSSGSALERFPVILPDGTGGALVFCEAELRDGEQQGDTDVLAQRISADGAMLWNEGKSSILVAASKWRERHAVVVSDGCGGAIAVFEQHAPPDSFAGDVDVAAEHVTADGDTPWSTEEEDRAADISATNELLEQAPSAASDGAGGAIVVFEAEPRIGKQAGRAGLLAQRLDANGKPLWNDGKPVTVAGGASERHPVVVAP